MDINPTDGIKFEKDDICTDLGNKLGGLQRGLDRTINQGRTLANSGLKNAISNVIPGPDIIDISEIENSIDEAKNGFDALKDKLGDQDIGGQDIQTLMECLSGLSGLEGGLDLFDKFNPLNMIDGKLDVSFVGKILDGAADWLSDNASKGIDLLLTPTEKILSGMISSLSKLLDIAALDKMLQLLQCLEECPGASGFNSSPKPINQYEIYCIEEKKKYTVFSETEPGATGCPNNHFIDMNQTKLIRKNVPSSVVLEDQLSKAGLTLNGDIDWDSDVFSDVSIPPEVKEKADKVLEAKKGIADKLADAKKFSPIPEVPPIPEIPKIENPLNELSVAKKIAALF
jgi:hypothetical protein